MAHVGRIANRALARFGQRYRRRRRDRRCVTRDLALTTTRLPMLTPSPMLALSTYGHAEFFPTRVSRRRTQSNEASRCVPHRPHARWCRGQHGIGRSDRQARGRRRWIDRAPQPGGAARRHQAPLHHGADRRHQDPDARREDAGRAVPQHPAPHPEAPSGLRRARPARSRLPSRLQEQRALLRRVQRVSARRLHPRQGGVVRPHELRRRVQGLGLEPEQGRPAQRADTDQDRLAAVQPQRPLDRVRAGRVPVHLDR